MEPPRVEGSVTGVADGAVVGWIAPDQDVVELELLAEGDGVVASTRATADAGGRAPFSIPIPGRLWDGRVRFLSVRPAGARVALEGGPLVFDGGLFGAAPDVRETQPPTKVEGEVELVAGRILRGWAWTPSDPAERVAVEIWSGGELLQTIVADAPHDPRPEAPEATAYGFSVDLSRTLKGGPHWVTVQAAGAEAPLRGGRIRVEPLTRDGEVGLPGYLDDEESSRLLAAAPFEHFVYDAARMSATRLAPRLVNRLRRERIGLARAESRIHLMAIGELEPATEAMWMRQSHPNVSLAAAPSDPAGLRGQALDADWVLFGRPGDIIHPSAAGLAHAAAGADVLHWNRLCADEAVAGSPGALLRRPSFDPVTWRHGAVTDTCLAVRGAVLARAPDGVLQALAAGRLHPLHFWLAGQDLRFTLHPEALTVCVEPPRLPDRAEVALDEPLYADILTGEGERFTLGQTAADHPFPFALIPVRRASKVSVLICYRDRPELTLRCIHSIARQHLTGDLELVLVDNQSIEDAARRVVEGAVAMLGQERVIALSYPHPFNHSAQNNLAAEAASGEVLVICNNDVMVQEPTALEQLAAWALCDGVGTVGCRLQDPRSERGSYGHVFTPYADDPFRPPVQENSDPTYAGLVHACPGNTLALAAIARERFLGLGGLDAVRFPIGYNDSDLMLRCARDGLTHLYLGHVRADHARGSSRTGDNEDLQALLINQLYAAQIAGRFTQLVRERLEVREHVARAEPAPTVDSVAELRLAMQARQRMEGERERMARGLHTATDLARRLAEELDVVRTTAMDG